MQDNVPDGAISSDGLVMGTYLHGLFESESACNALLAWAGLQQPQTPNYHQLRERSIERLAHVVEDYLNMDLLAEILGLADRKA